MKFRPVFFLLLSAGAVICLSAGEKKALHLLDRQDWFVDRDYADSAAFFSADTIVFLPDRGWPVSDVRDSIRETNVKLECGFFVREGFVLHIAPAKKEPGERAAWKRGKEYYGTIAKKRRSKEITLSFRECENSDAFWNCPVTLTMKYEVLECTRKKLVLVKK